MVPRFIFAPHNGSFEKSLGASGSYVGCTGKDLTSTFDRVSVPPVEFRQAARVIFSMVNARTAQGHVTRKLRSDMTPAQLP